MANWVEISAKTIDEALTEALIELEATSDQVEYEILEEPSSGFLGIGSKPAKIRVKKKETPDSRADEFLNDLLKSMGIIPDYTMEYNEEEGVIYIDIKSAGKGILIGKRGQTLDSIQYLTSLVANKDSEEYIKIKIDTENYRDRRKKTIENLAKNVASKVKKTGTTVRLEPMNPYERRIIHSTLQDDKYVRTYSEGEEPHRKVVVTVTKEYENMPKKRNNNYRGKKGSYGNKGGYGKGGYGKGGSYKKGGYKKNFKKDYNKSYKDNNKDNKEIKSESSEAKDN